MTIDRERLLAVAQSERVALGRTIQSTAPEAWDTTSRLDGWRLRDVVAHLAASEGAAAAAFGSLPAAEIEEFLKEEQDLTIDAFNDWTVRKRADAQLRELAVEWGRNADATLVRAAAIPEDDWTSTRVSWLAGEIPAGSLLQSRVMEWWGHGEAIRAGAEDFLTKPVSSEQLMDAIDNFIPLPTREVDKPFLMCIEDVFNIEGRGTVVTGRVERGELKRMDNVEIVGLKSLVLRG